MSGKASTMKCLIHCARIRKPIDFGQGEGGRGKVEGVRFKVEGNQILNIQCSIFNIQVDSDLRTHLRIEHLNIEY
jgi:hypothetical protein